MRFVIVTGISGGGKNTALKMLEDAGYYCVDNLPVQLIEKFVELVVIPNGEMNKVALGLDVRADQPFDEVEDTLDKLDCAEEVLIKRFKETRRTHPLSLDGRVEDGVRKERQILQGIRRKADYVIDSSKLLTRELKEELDRIFVRNEEYNSLMITILSFGFKNGIPTDADLVFDVRFLPNPYYIEELKYRTGNDEAVRDYVMGFPEAGQFLDKLHDMMEFLISGYIKEGKNQLVVAIGCTGGRHRSVALANELYKRLKDKGNYGIRLAHRDEKQER